MVAILQSSMERRERKKSWQESGLMWKCIFRFLAVVTSTAGLVIQAIVAVRSVNEANRQSNSSGSYSYYYYGSTWYSPESFTFVSFSFEQPNLLLTDTENVQFGISFLWCSAELLVIRRNKRGMNPGGLVALDLLIWMGLLSSGVVEVLISSSNPMSLVGGALGIISS